MIHGQDDEAAGNGRSSRISRREASRSGRERAAIRSVFLSIAPRGAGSFSRFFKALTSRSQNAGRLCARRVRRHWVGGGNGTSADRGEEIVLSEEGARSEKSRRSGQQEIILGSHTCLWTRGASSILTVSMPRQKRVRTIYALALLAPAGQWLPLPAYQRG